MSTVKQACEEDRKERQKESLIPRLKEDKKKIMQVYGIQQAMKIG